MGEIIKVTKMRVGNLVVFEGELYRVHSVDHRTPGKGNACIQTKLRHLAKGNLIDKRFLSDVKIEKASLDTHDMEFLYEEDNGYIFMNNESYEQMTLSKELIDEDAGYLLPNMNIKVEFYNEEPVGIQLPLTVTLKVTDTEPYVKKATASAQTKPATLETGLKVIVPGFVQVGEAIRVNTETGEYIERA